MVQVRGRMLAAIALVPLAVGTARSASVSTLYQVAGSGDGALVLSGLTKVGATLYGATGSGGTFGEGALYSINPATGAEQVVYSFPPGKFAYNINLSGALISVNGVLYGTGPGAGSSGMGAVFSFNPATGSERILYSFTGGTDGISPDTGLVEAGGMLYGTTPWGGKFSNGTVFSIDPTTGVEKVLYSFPTGNASYPSALIAIGGKLYGTTGYGGTYGSGTVFEVDRASGAGKVIYSFTGGLDGAGPSVALLDVGGTLFGVATGGGSFGQGTVFSINPTTRVEQTVYSFAGGSDGSAPSSALINVGGTLFGTTYAGGAVSPGRGTVFSINPTTGAEAVIHRFAGGFDGTEPAAALINTNGALYGTTESGGTSERGTVYSIKPASGVEAVLHNFTGGTSAAANSVINANGALFLSASAGGFGSLGSIVKIDPATRAATEIYDFASSNQGEIPDSLVSIGNLLYGTTQYGGYPTLPGTVYGPGTVFSLNPATGVETVLHGFGGPPDGYGPNAAPINVGGTLYGTTVSGGIGNTSGFFGDGTFYAINPVTGAEKVLYNFYGGNNDAGSPGGALININGILFGTGGGGAFNGGAAFAIDPINGAELMIHSFGGSFGARDGQNPSGAIINVGGILYGTTFGGGNFGGGTIFSLNPTTWAEKVLYNFPYVSDVSGPGGALVNIGHKFYGITYRDGTYGAGTVFSFDLATGVEKILYNFTGGTDGGVPSSLIKIGKTLYGTTDEGGTMGRGTVFMLTR